MTTEGALTPNSATYQPAHEVQPSRRRFNSVVLVLYAAISFIWILGINYMEEARAYRQLRSETALFSLQSSPDNSQAALELKPTWDGEMVWVQIYHEKYAVLSAKWWVVFSLFIVGIGVLLGWLAWLDEWSRQEWRLVPFVVLYFGIPWAMRYGFYPDMAGILVISPVYLVLFFVIRAVQRYNPHLALASPDGIIDLTRYKIIFSLYQRYFLLFITVLGFVAASLLVGASSMIESMYSRTDATGSAIYNAVHMPYLQALYSYLGFGCIALGFGAIKEMHNKMTDLLQMTPGPQHPSKPKKERESTD